MSGERFQLRRPQKGRLHAIAAFSSLAFQIGDPKRGGTEKRTSSLPSHMCWPLQKSANQQALSKLQRECKDLAKAATAWSMQRDSDGHTSYVVATSGIEGLVKRALEGWACSAQCNELTN